MSLIEELKRRQGSKTQAEFAYELGVAQAMLSYLYSGNRKIGKDVARRIIRLYPDLTEAVMAYLLGEEEDCLMSAGK